MSDNKERTRLLPPDWDQPGAGNDSLVRKFSKNIFRVPGYSLRYRLFVPETDEKVPLVLYLHGADAVGSDNDSQLSMHDIGTMFARESWQKRNPCIIVAPQYDQGEYWSDLGIATAIHSLLDQLIQQKNIDRSRIYIYGYSAGGVGTMSLLGMYPSMFAAALPICGATGRKYLETLATKPMWLVHAADDRIVRVSYGEGRDGIPAHMGSRDIYESIKDENCDLKYTEYPAGWMEEKYNVNPHCSWVAVSDPANEEMRNWLFRNVLK